MASRQTVASSKFVAVDALDNELPYPYDDRWSLERTTGPARLVIAPRRGSHVDVLLELARLLPEPFGILCRHGRASIVTGAIKARNRPTARRRKRSYRDSANTSKAMAVTTSG